MPAAAIGAVATVGAGLLSSQASKSAAKTAANATRDATAAQIESQREMFDIQRQDTAPWRYFGEQALGQLGAGFGIPAYAGQQTGGGAFTQQAAPATGGLISSATPASGQQATGTYNDLQAKDALLNYLAAERSKNGVDSFGQARSSFETQFSNMSLPDIFSAVGLANDPANIDRLVRINEAARYTDGGYQAAANLYGSTPTENIPLVGFATPTTTPVATQQTAEATPVAQQTGEFNTPDVFDPGKPEVLLALDPGYQFRLAEGEKALNRRLAASGISESGRAAKSLLRYGQDYGSQEYRAAYGRLFDTYRSRIADRTDRFNKLATLAGIGQTATAQSNAAAGNAAAGISAAYGQQGFNLASIYTNAGNQQAAAYQGIGSAIGAVFKNYMAYQNQQQQNALLQSFLSGGGGATTGGYSTGAGYFQKCMMADLSQIYAQQNAQTLGTLNFMQGVKQFQYKQQQDAQDLALKLREDFRDTEKHVADMTKAQREQAQQSAKEFNAGIQWVQQAKTPLEQKARLNQAIDFYSKMNPKAADQFSQWRDRVDMIPLLARYGRDTEALFKAPELQKFTRGEQEVTREVDPATGQAREIASGPRWEPKTGAGSGPFQGTSMDAQTMNILLQGNPNTPEYAAAYAYASRPRTYVDQTNGQLVTVNPDMSTYRPPVRGVADQMPTAPVAQMPQGQVPGTADQMQTPPAGGGQTITTTRIGQGRTTEGQSLSAGFANRMYDAEEILREVEQQGTNAAGNFLEKLPGGNYLQSPEYQRFEQARRNFVNAVLRRESGAAISDSEFENANRQYFPVPGDSSEVIEQKRQNRMAAIRSLEESAGPRYQRPTIAQIRAAGSVEDLAKLDPSKMSDNELLAAEERFRELTRGR